MNWFTFLIVAAISWPPVFFEFARYRRFQKIVARHRAADALADRLRATNTKGDS